MHCFQLGAEGREAGKGAYRQETASFKVFFVLVLLCVCVFSTNAGALQKAGLRKFYLCDF